MIGAKGAGATGLGDWNWACETSPDAPGGKRTRGCCAKRALGIAPRTHAHRTMQAEEICECKRITFFLK